MTNERPKVSIQPNSKNALDHTLVTTITEKQRERYEEFVKEHEFSSRAEGLRYLLNLGLRSAIQNDPTASDQDEAAKIEESAATIRDFIPEGEENKIDMKDELPEIIKNEILDVVEEDPKINRDSFEVYL